MILKSMKKSKILQKVYMILLNHRKVQKHNHFKNINILMVMNIKNPGINNKNQN